HSIKTNFLSSSLWVPDSAYALISTSSCCALILHSHCANPGTPKMTGGYLTKSTSPALDGEATIWFSISRLAILSDPHRNYFCVLISSNQRNNTGSDAGMALNRLSLTKYA